MNLLDLFNGLLENARNNDMDFATEGELKDYFYDYAEYAKTNEDGEFETVELTDEAIGIMLVAFRAEEQEVITNSNDRFYIYERVMTEIEL